MEPPPQPRCSAPRSSRRPPLRRGARSACTLGRQTAFSAQRPASQRVPLGEARCGSAWGVTLRIGRERATASQGARSGKASSGIAAPERAPATTDGRACGRAVGAAADLSAVLQPLSAGVGNGGRMQFTRMPKLTAVGSARHERAGADPLRRRTALRAQCRGSGEPLARGARGGRDRCGAGTGSDPSRRPSRSTSPVGGECNPQMLSRSAGHRG